MFATAVAYLHMFPVSDFDSSVKRNPPVADGNSMMSVHGSLSAGEGLPSPKNMFSEALLHNQTERATTNAVVAVTPTDINSTSTSSRHSSNSNRDGSSSSSSDAPSTPTPSMPTPAMTPATSASLQTPSRRAAAATDSTMHNFGHNHPTKGGIDGNGGSSSIPNNSSGNGDSGGSPYFQHDGNNDNADDDNDDDDEEEVHSDNSEWFERNGNSKTKSGRRRRRSFWAALRTALLPTELVMVCGWLLFFCIEVFVFVFLFPYFFCSNTRLEAR